MKALELRIPPLAVLAVVALGMAAAAWLVVPGPLSWGGRWQVALGFAGAGGLLALAGVVAFKRQHTTVNPFSPERSSSLVVSGIYRFSRNPMYLGFLLMLAGWAMGSAMAAWLLPLFVLYLNRFQIRPEEQMLQERFGAEFVAYAKTVGRWL